MTRLTDAALLLIALALAAWVYAPITQNFFQYDDFLHLFRIVNESWLKFLLTMHGGHLLITRNALFLLCYELFGTAPAGYLWVALVTHLVNVSLLFGIIRRLTDSARLACFGAAVWGILPVHDGVLGWYSAYAHALATTFTFLVLFGIVRAVRGPWPHPLTVLGWILLLLAAATSFGVGIGVAMAIPIAALLLLPASPRRTRVVLALAVVALAMPLVYIAFERLFVELYGHSTSTQLLAFYRWPKHVMFALSLLGYGILLVAFGVIGPILPYPGVASGIIIAAFALAVVAVLARGTSDARRRTIAGLTIAAAAYGVIAAGRMLYITEGGYASMAAVGRYHYLGTAALTVVSCLLLHAIARRARVPAWAASALLLTWLGFTVLAHRTIGPRIRHYNAARLETRWVLDQVEVATQSAPEGADVYIENRVFESMRFDRGDGFPGWAAVFSIFFSDNTVGGRRVRFVEPDLLVIEATREGRRTAGLLIAPDEAPADVYRPTDQPDLRQRARRDRPEQVDAATQSP